MKVTVSEKGQVTIPKRLRERLGIRAGQILDFEERDGAIVARKAGSADAVAEVYGSLKLSEPIDDFVRRIRGPHARRSGNSRRRGRSRQRVAIASGPAEPPG